MMLHSVEHHVKGDAACTECAFAESHLYSQKFTNLVAAMSGGYKPSVEDKIESAEQC